MRDDSYANLQYVNDIALLSRASDDTYIPQNKVHSQIDYLLWIRVYKAHKLHCMQAHAPTGDICDYI